MKSQLLALHNYIIYNPITKFGNAFERSKTLTIFLCYELENLYVFTHFISLYISFNY